MATNQSEIAKGNDDWKLTDSLSYHDENNQWVFGTTTVQWALMLWMNEKLIWKGSDRILIINNFINALFWVFFFFTK